MKLFLPILAASGLTGCGSIAPEQGRERIITIGIGLVDRVIAPQAQQQSVAPAAAPLPSPRSK